MILRRLLQLITTADRQPAPGPVGPPPGAPLPRPPAVVTIDRDKIPAGARERVAQILTLLSDLDARCEARNDVGPQDELERIRTLHLPRLIQSYVDIPPEHRAEVFRETGRSASYILAEELDKLLARLREISLMIARGDVDAFTQNVRFIDMQYGSPFPDID